MYSKIVDLNYFLPEIVLTNNELVEKFPEWDALKISEKVGVKERHIAGQNETALDLAVKASEKVLINFKKDDIDFLILCTQSPDYYLPTSSCIIQDRLKLKNNIGAFDFNLGCSGYIYGLAISKSLIISGIASHVLLIMSETYTKHIHPKDKVNKSIFGDAAAATIISADINEHIFNFELGTDGTGMNQLIIPNGGLRNKYNPDETDYFDNSGNIRNNNCLYMNGGEIFNFTLEKVPGLVTKTLEKNSLTLEQIDYVIFHQANKFMLDYLRKKMKIPIEKFYQNMEKTGNTVSATIPIALKDCIENGTVKKGDKILLVGFGVGYSWGATVIEI